MSGVAVSAADAAWTSWARETPVLAAGTNGYVRVVVPVAALDARGEIADLRVIDDRGTETPFAEEAPDGAAVAIEMSPIYAFDRATHLETWTYPLPLASGDAHIRFSGGTIPYARDVTIESSVAGEDWEFVASRTLTNLGKGPVRDIAFTVAPGARIRAIVADRDDAPVPGLRPTIFGRVHTIVFRALPHRMYRLVSGNDAVVAARYDLPERLRAHPERTCEVRVGPTYANPNYRDLRPLGERMPWTIDTLMATLALVLALIATTTLRGRPLTDSAQAPG